MADNRKTLRFPNGNEEDEAEEREEREERKRRLIKFFVFLGILAAAAITVFSLRVTKVEVVGNSHYTEEEIIDLFYPTFKERILLYDYMRDMLGRNPSAAFIQSYEKNRPDLNTVELVIYEKSIVGCISYMGTYMYFDKDGVIVESSAEPISQVPVVKGLHFNQIVLYQKLPVKNAEGFEAILNLTQLIAIHELPVYEVEYDNYRNATVRLNDTTGPDGQNLVLSGVTVELGASTDMEEKIGELSSQLPYLSGLKGVLHLETYDRNSLHPSYVFEQDEATTEASEPVD